MTRNDHQCLSKETTALTQQLTLTQFNPAANNHIHPQRYTPPRRIPSYVPSFRQHFSLGNEKLTVLHMPPTNISLKGRRTKTVKTRICLISADNTTGMKMVPAWYLQ
ncbi:unnamed protein product [Adineta ricciae]|uniref:Uncharacterized protein n=1 Tax=Adineta ricciae TaxID=249248 RepID=A0A815Q881_ADIRI|nr:unnamed protein product [Adineta ricciae]CAF1556583.1 unnamed protein product [Adineta ricciae]